MEGMEGRVGGVEGGVSGGGMEGRVGGVGGVFLETIVGEGEMGGG